MYLNAIEQPDQNATRWCCLWKCPATPRHLPCHPPRAPTHLLRVGVCADVCVCSCRTSYTRTRARTAADIARLPSSLLSTFLCPSPPWGKEYMNSPATSSILTYLAQPPPARGSMANKRNPGSHAEVHTDYTERRRFSPSF